ncbi:MAG: ABC transporter ATP-binding protein, partial [Planctomycetes bacterium]|nr:ABC transporter ATP-binding protein [Planctomycetota bacterium]
SMRRELALLQRELRTTTVHVTHDQSEALQLGQRIAVLNDGRLQQVGSPAEVYDRPVNRFVAGFIGSPQMNFFAARMTDRNGRTWLDATDFTLPWPEPAAAPNMPDDACEISVGIRPEHLTIGARADGEDDTCWPAEILLVQSFGPETRLELRSASHRFTVCGPPRSRCRPGDLVSVQADPSRCHVFDDRSGRRL